MSFCPGILKQCKQTHNVGEKALSIHSDTPMVTPNSFNPWYLPPPTWRTRNVFLVSQLSCTILLGNLHYLSTHLKQQPADKPRPLVKPEENDLHLCWPFHIYDALPDFWKDDWLVWSHKSSNNRATMNIAWRYNDRWSFTRYDMG